MQGFRALGSPPADPLASGGWGFCPQTPSLQQLGASPPDPQNSPPLRIFGFAPVDNIATYNASTLQPTSGFQIAEYVQN